MSKPRRVRPDPGLEAAIGAAGSITKLAAKIGTSHQNICTWRRVPVSRLIAVEEATGVPRETLRPDLYRRAGGLTDGTVCAAG